MLSRLNHSRLLRFAGLFTWGMVGMWLVQLWLDPGGLVLAAEGQGSFDLLVARWVALYLTFGGAYWWITRDLGSQRPTLLSHVLLLVLTLCAIGVSYLSSTGLGSILLMVVAGLLPWLLSLRVGIAWLIGGNLVIAPVFVTIGMPLLIAVAQSLAYVGFSSLVFVTALVAKQQAQAREEQRRLNAELRATRLLLAESARINERTRISRELHDLLGHHLTALSLNLEVAGHLVDGRARDHVGQAHTLAKLLLTDVREAVSEMREDGTVDLAGAIRTLIEGVPALDIRLEIAEPLGIEDPERAHVLLRCTQEIITNTVRHAGASTLWLSVSRDTREARILARDDGGGAEEPAPGNGLRGMRERLVSCGGRLDIITGRGQGFALDIRLPLENAA